MSKEDNLEKARQHYLTRAERRPKQTWGGKQIGWVKTPC